MHDVVLGICAAKAFASEPGLRLPRDISFYESFADNISNCDFVAAFTDFTAALADNGLDSYCKYLPGQKIVFLEGFKEAYFQRAYSNVLKMLLRPDGLSRFSSDTNWARALHENISKPFDVYIADEHFACETLDDWVRLIDYGEEYVVYDALDYHY